MGELGAKLGLDELTGGAAGISRALLAEFIGKPNTFSLQRANNHKPR